LTPDFGKLSISPESSDGFASVGTILPKEEVTLLPGGLFAFRDTIKSVLCERRGEKKMQSISRRDESLDALPVANGGDRVMVWRNGVGTIFSAEQT
jgi:hypothetical protein